MKGLVVRLAKRARTPLPVPLSFLSASSSSSSSSSWAPSSESETRVNQLVPSIICEEEEEEDIASNLRVGFQERQRKCLFESIAVNPSPSKKDYLEPAYHEPACPKPVSTLAPVPVSSTIAIKITLEPDEKTSFL
ncbi:hypothetical protein PVL29_003618 [Vitis rotundifolia]|uniref:Uncharacterized protein n=1 Tax=Vitis rotundifolia TaxID=103349 RepID=A0AA39ADJ4_VITRO|nr:hypothetical protein PVL29_003618 [Vitis rotundifolia]